MKKRVLACLLLSILLSCCDRSPHQNLEPHSLKISGRDEKGNLMRKPVYQIEIPSHWEILYPKETDSIEDTKKPLIEFLIEKNIRITIHNFPTIDIERRIPPMAQIARWKKQFKWFDPVSIIITPIAFAGFEGLAFQANGLIEGKSEAVLAWALQLAPMHYQNLIYPYFKEDEWLWKQMRSDVTIKAVGDPNMIDKYHNEIQQASESFELIKEIPL